jgi:hypothetical protein
MPGGSVTSVKGKVAGGSQLGSEKKKLLRNGEYKDVPAAAPAL